MLPRYQLTQALLDLASAQAGVVTKSQALGCGVPDGSFKRLQQSWTRVASGIYCLDALSWLGVAWAAALRGGEGAALTGAAGAFLSDAVRDEPNEIVVRVAGKKRNFVCNNVLVRYVRGVVPARGEPPRAALEQCLIDVAEHCGEVDTVAAVTRAFAKRKTTANRLSAHLESLNKCSRRALLTSLCDLGSQGLESVLEWRFHERVVRPHGLPTPERQFRTGRAQIDGLYREFATIVELDGMRDHSLWSKDMMRDNVHAIRHGWLTLRYGWWAVENSPCEVAAQLARALRDRGWTGQYRACSDCRRVPLQW